MRDALILSLAGVLLSSLVVAQEPPLPAGLGQPEDDEPALPAGLGQPPAEPALPSGLGQEPALPSGLGTSPSQDNETRERDDNQGLPFSLNGFIETRLGTRLHDDPVQKDQSIGEVRWQLRLQQDLDWAQLAVTADLLFDPVLDDHRLDIDAGTGWLDLREASLLFRPTDNTDLQLGRQVLTWGTGDLLFINDLFPKDWNAFFIGRQDEYLKAPSDAIKLAYFNDLANIDLVYTPRFDSDRFIDGSRVSYYSPMLGRNAGRDDPLVIDTRNRWLREDEIALRAYRSLGSWEAALYGYRGYWKSPGGQDPVTGATLFPRLSALGASMRGPLAAGIAAFEIGYYDSEDDSRGDDPFINNSEFRLLAGYEQEILPQLTLGVQYYLEWLQDYSDYRRSLPAGFEAREERRHVITARLTRLLMNQNLMLSLFNYYSPSDEDGYLRLNVNYKVSDNWQVEAGANVFYGEERHTFFGQFEDNNNLFLGLRYSF